MWRPDGGAFFDREGLLFESTDEVSQTMQRLIAAQPLLGSACRGSERARPDGRAVAPPRRGPARSSAASTSWRNRSAALADAFDGIVAGRAPAFSWQTLITGRAPSRASCAASSSCSRCSTTARCSPASVPERAIRQAARELGLDADPRVRVRLTGPVPLADEEFATLADGAALNVTIMLTAVVVLLWIALRSWRLIAAILLSLAVGLIVTAAFGLIAFGTFNLISVAFAVLFVGLGVDFGIQFCVCYRARRHASDDLQLALARRRRAKSAARWRSPPRRSRPASMRSCRPNIAACPSSA